MKKYILFVFMIAVIGALVFVPGCKRSDLADPDMHEPAGFIINLSGVANPGTLFVTQGGGWQNSYINMTALYNNGSPVAGKSIFMKINEEFGTFPGDKRTAVITTNSQGKASIRYSISQLAIDQIGADLLIYIQAWLQVDLYNVYDNVPLQLVTNMPDIDVNTLAHLVNGSTSIASEGGSFDVYFYNSTGDDSISFVVTIGDTSMVTASSTSGTTPETITFTVAENQSGTPRSTTITIAAISPDGVFGSPITIPVTQGYSNTFSYTITAGDPTNISSSTGGQFTIYLYNSTGTDVINYTVTYTDPNTILSPTPASGSTPNSITYNVSSGTAGWMATIIFTENTAPFTSYTIQVILQ